MRLLIGSTSKGKDHGVGVRVSVPRILGVEALRGAEEAMERGTLVEAELRERRVDVVGVGEGQQVQLVQRHARQPHQE